jgi:hypothetical protein
LIEHRGLRPPWPSSLSWSARYQSYPGVTPRPCLIASVTNTDGEIVALQSTELNLETGAKSSRTDKPRRSRGPVGEGAVFLGSWDDPSQTLVLGEGVETCSRAVWSGHAMRMRASDRSGPLSQNFTIAASKSSLTPTNVRRPAGYRGIMRSATSRPTL